MSEERPPVIGIGAAREPASWAVWELPAALVASNYLEAIETEGGIPLLIPPNALVVEHPDVILDRVDGLVMVGGADLDPAQYGAATSPDTEEVMPERDQPEIALVRRAHERGIPVLGICRGLQVINVAFGGTLRQHLPTEVGHEGHRRTLGSFDGIDHDVDIEPSSRIAQIEGGVDASVKSHHHQGVAELGRGLVVTARSKDGVVEALEAIGPGAAYLVGVQWHPEADPESRVIASLVEAARATGTPGSPHE